MVGGLTFNGVYTANRAVSGWSNVHTKPLFPAGQHNRSTLSIGSGRGPMEAPVVLYVVPFGHQVQYIVNHALGCPFNRLGSNPNSYPQQVSVGARPPILIPFCAQPLDERNLAD